MKQPKSCSALRTRTAKWLINCALFLFLAPAAPAQPELTRLARHNQYVIAEMLKKVRPGQDTVLVDDMVFRVSDLRDFQKTQAALLGRQWVNNLVYYSFHITLPQNVRDAFLQAVQIWEAAAPVKFIERTTEVNYIEVQLQNSNYSPVGMNGGKQAMGLAANAGVATALHEIGHALGMQHEHQRSDRDNYVTIFLENVDPNQQNNFTLITQTINYTPYDFLSIMHYERRAFSTNGQNTIEPRPEYMQYLDIMGRVSTLSDFDREAMRKLYSMIPVLLAPAEGAANIEIAGTPVQWSTVSGALAYEIQVSTDSAFAETYSDRVVQAKHQQFDAVGTQSDSIKALLPSTRFYWRVRAHAADSVAQWTDARMFKTRIAGPAAVVLISPEDGAALPPGQVTLVWQQSDEADFYEVEVATDSGFVQLAFQHRSVISNRTTVSSLPANQVYYWRVRPRNAIGPGPWSPVRHFVLGVATAIERAEAAPPATFFLSQNYPNPFNPQTRFDFALPAPAHVRLAIFDLQGRRVAVLIDQQMPAGIFTYRWAPADMAGGVYFYTLEADAHRLTRKLTLLK